jgi:hypothetical protein
MLMVSILQLEDIEWQVELKSKACCGSSGKVHALQVKDLSSNASQKNSKT